MFLNTNFLKPILVFLMVIPMVFSVSGQEEKSTDTNKKYASFSIGYINPIAVGNNMANEAFDVNSGWEHSVWLHITKNIRIGTKFSIFDAAVQRKELTGNYNDATIFSFGPVGGYHFDLLPRIGLLLGSGFGYVGYDNHHSKYNFSDSGLTLWFFGNLNFDFTKRFSLYLNGSFRHDFLNVKTGGTKDNYFDPSYIVLSLGIRFTI